MSTPTLAGVDFGSKLAGTTAIAYLGPDNRFLLEMSHKGQNADEFLQNWLALHRPEYLFIDAPLSLPGVYRGLTGFTDYFYRQADRSLSAMSPMFLGGLTARAMRLKAELAGLDIQVYEVYPVALAREIALPPALYRKDSSAIPTLLPLLEGFLPQLPEQELVASWHHFDALLAWLSGWRYLQGCHQLHGHPAEGQILV